MTGTVDRPPLRVLSIEDEPAFSDLAQRLLEREGYSVAIERVESAAQLEAALDRQSWDVVLSDHSMPDFSSAEALELIKGRGLDLPFILVSAYIGEEAAVAAMRAGAHDYIPKASLNRLGIAVRSALADAAERASLRQRERDLEALHAVAFAAGTALDAERLGAFATDRARELLSVDVALLLWWNPALAALERLARSPNVSNVLNDSLTGGQGIGGAAFSSREPVVVDDYQRWPNRTTDETQSAAAVPLFVGERVVGVLVVTSGAVRRQFRPDEIRVLSVLGAEIAPAIEASRLLAAATHAAQYDSLTGLPNRALFMDRLGAQLAVGRPFALMYADLDDFRAVNDAFGHDAGDAVLRALGVRLRGLGGVGDAVARFGADEFGVLFPPGSDLAQATRAAEGALEFLQQPFIVGEQPVHLGASIGIAAYPDHATDAQLLLQRAESAMHAAKRSRARYRVYSAELDPQSQRRIALVSELRAAMAANELVLYYQPQVEIASNTLVGAEALLRWNHPQRGLVPPMEFIPVAEQTGLILDLTPWVIANALRQLQVWRAAGVGLRISVNIAMRNLQDPEFPEQVEALFKLWPVPAGSLVLEVTEGTIMLEAERTLAVLKGIRAMGQGVSIDDFGTGYSSLSYLSQLPADEIKIDKSFIMAIDAPENHAIVAAVTDLGRALGKRVVAEGVQDERAWNALAAMGCPIAQGYHLSPPVPIPQFDEWRRSRER